MAKFENHAHVAQSIASEIERKLVILGIDWNDVGAVAHVANRLLDYGGAQAVRRAEPYSQEAAFVDLFGLVGVMLRTMEEGADSGRRLHGNDAWKCLARALWNEKDRRA